MVIAPWLLSLAAISTPLPPPLTEITTSDILQVTDFSGLATSPDGRWLVFRTSRPDLASDGYRIGWWVMPTDGSASPRQIAEGGDMLFNVAGAPDDQTPVWSPQSDALYYRALVDGQIQIWRADLAGHAPRPVTQDPADIQDLAIDNKGSALVYHVGASRDAIEAAERRARDEGVLVDETVDIAQPISRGGIVDGKPGSQRFTPGWFARGNILWETPSREVRIDLPRSPAPVGFGGGGITPHVSDDLTSLKVSMPDGREILCPTESCRTGRVVSAIALRDQSVLVTTVDRTINETLSIWRPGVSDERILKRTIGLLNGGRSPDSGCAANDGTIFCVAASAISPPRLVAIDLQHGAEKDLFDPNTELRHRIAMPVRELHWKTRDGVPMTGQLILPATPKPAGGYPLVINYYACWEFLRGGVGDELPMLPLASHGIAALCINRAHTPKAMGDDHPWSYDHAIDAIDRISRQLSEQGIADRRHMGIWGLSFGSEIAMQASWRLPWLSAVAIATGTVDPDFYWFNSVRGRDTAGAFRDYWKAGDPVHDTRGWNRISPAAHADALHMPLLMQMPEQEARWSLELYSRLSNSTTPVEMYAFANEPHVKARPRHKQAAYDRNLDWFRFWLTGERDPAMGKEAQYRRWSSLAARAGLAPDALHVPHP